MPLSFRLPRIIGNFSIDVAKPSVLPYPEYMAIEKIIADINRVVDSIVPGLSLMVISHGPQLMGDGNEGMRFELASFRNGKSIPFRYESEGIRKIISILHVLVSAYNNPSILVAVDELDAGVYEYLLGEILQVFAETGQGQLIFTAHNLRVLEVLDKSSIVFTTTNPENRYIAPKYIKSNNNLRDVYLHSIRFGGQDEELYNETKLYAIRTAMRKAGEAVE